MKTLLLSWAVALPWCLVLLILTFPLVEEADAAVRMIFGWLWGVAALLLASGVSLWLELRR